jgi:VWFA-related protein
MRFLPKISAVLFVAVALASGQDAAPAKPQGELPTFKTKAELVLVPVVVSDKNGEHVHGLKKEDFAILEDDRTKEISVFEPVHTEPRVMQLSSAHDVFTNTVKPEATQARVTILVLDTLNTAFFDQVTAKHEILKFLSSLEPGEPVALLNLSKSGLHVIHDFTTDPKILAEAVRQVRGQLAMKDTGGGDRVSENLPTLGGRSGRISEDIVPDTIGVGDVRAGSAEANNLLSIQTETEGVFSHIEQSYSIRVTLEAMRQIAKAFSGVPGRKSVIWATGGIPFSVDDPSRIGFLTAELLPLYEGAWRDLNNANVAVYPLEVTKLSNPAYNPASVSGRRALRSRRPLYTNGNTDNLELFANMTGGRYCPYASDIKQCFHEATDDSGDYYTLAYSIDSTHLKPGWHKIKVKLLKGDYQVRARSGYFVAEPHKDKNPEQQGDAEVAMGLTAPMDYTELPFSVRWTGKANAGEKDTFRFRYNIAPANVDEGTNNHISIGFAALATDSKGKPLGEFSKVMEGDLSPEMAAGVRVKGLSFDGTIDLPPGTDQSLRFLVRDNLTGKMGSVTVRALPR